jgi:xanthine dehydrogenase accessory factor
VRDILDVVAGWARAERPAALATLARVRRSAPRLVGSAMARAADGRVAGSVTGGCVESDLIVQAEDVLGGGPPRLLSYGIDDADAFAVGLPCGGEVEVFVESVDAALVIELDAEVRGERPVAYVTGMSGALLGQRAVVRLAGPARGGFDSAARPHLALGESGVVALPEGEVLVVALAPRPALYILGAIDFASALARVGAFLGYRVTVCDPRTAFLTPERFPDVGELVAEWPHEFLASAPVDPRTAICVLTHDDRFDVPALRAALATDAGYVGAMGSRRTTARRRGRLIAEGLAVGDLERIHAPIGLPIRSRTPEEVAISIGAEIVRTMRAAAESGVPV